MQAPSPPLAMGRRGDGRPSGAARLAFAAVVALALAACDAGPSLPVERDAPQAAATNDRALRDAIAGRARDRWVTGAGEVAAVLSDDTRGGRHQRFVLRLPGGGTLLVAHNIDLAPRIDGLRRGDRVEFTGEYEWNERGGVVHWTHHDPRGQRRGGWLRHAGRTYR